MMMNFIDLSAASEEERRLIREILSDTSIVNIATPPQLHPDNSTVSNATTLIATAPTTTTSKHLNASSSNTPPAKITTTTFSSFSSTTNTTTTTTITTTLDTQQQLNHQQHHHHHQNQQQQIYQQNKSAQQLQHNLPSVTISNTVEASQQKTINSSSSVEIGAVAPTTTANTSTAAITATVASNQQDNFNKLAIKSQQTLALSTKPNALTNAHHQQHLHQNQQHQHHYHHPQQLINSVNELDVNIDSEVVDTSKSVQLQQQKGANITPEANAPSITNVHNSQQQPSQPQQQQHQSINNSQSRQQHINGQRQSFKNSPNQHLNFSNNSNNGHDGNSNTNLMGPNAVSSLNHRNSYSNQRKNIHNNSGNSSNSISVNSGNNNNNNNRNTRLSSSNNPVSGVNNVQLHYPQQYASPLPSNTSPSTQYHNINVNNTNNHSANALASQLNQQQQRTTNEHSNDRLRSGGMCNHINSNNDVNIVVTSSSALVALTQNLDQHHGSTMPLSVYNHPTTHMHHQVPPVMPTAKLDPKNNNNLKNQTYHPQDTSNTNIQNTTSGAQTVQPSAQMPQLAGDMNSVIGMDMTSTQPPGYAIPPHVAAFGPPAHHVYGGAPIFQPYHYLIPYNIPICPYVLPTNSVVPPRQQVPPQSNQSQNNSSNAVNTHPRHLTQQHQDHEQYHNLNNNNNQNNLQLVNKDEKNLNKDPNLSHQSQNLKKNYSEKEAPEGSKQGSTASIKTTQNNANSQNDNQSLQHQQKPDKHKKPQQESDSSLDNVGGHSNVKSSSLEQVGGNMDKQNKLVSNIKPINVSRNNNSSIVTKYKSVVPSIRGDKSENQQQHKHETDSKQIDNNSVKIQHLHKNVNSDINRDNNERYQDAPTSAIVGKTVEESVKISSDEGFETQSSLDVSKQSHDTSIPVSELSKLSPAENCNKSLNEKKARYSSELNNDKINEVPQKTAGVWGAASSKSWADLFKREGALIGSSINGEIEHNISGSENSDEEIRAQRSTSIKLDSSIKTKSRINYSKEQRSKEAAKRALDDMAPKLAQKVASLNLKHALPFLKPRGFINKGNGCYINATLQALIACPPFYNLMKEIGDLRGYRRENSCTPILDSFAEFFLNFPPLDSGKKNKQSSSQDQKMHINYLQAEAIEPKCIYNALGQIKSECLKGKFFHCYSLAPIKEKHVNSLFQHIYHNYLK